MEECKHIREYLLLSEIRVAESGLDPVALGDGLVQYQSISGFSSVAV